MRRARGEDLRPGSPHREAHWPNRDRRNQDKAFNLMTVSELKAYAPISVERHLAAAHISENKNGAERNWRWRKSPPPVLAKIFAEPSGGVAGLYDRPLPA